MPDMLAWQWSGLGDACQSAKMAPLLNSLFFPCLKFRCCVRYYDYIVKWCSGIVCNWCVSLDIALILALSFYQSSLVSVAVGHGCGARWQSCLSTYQGDIQLGGR